MIHSYFVRFLKQDWFWEHTLPEYRMKKLDSFAGILAAALHREPRQDIAAAQNNRNALSARNFLKNLTVDGPHIRALRSELIAAKLGISSEVLVHNPGFEKFAVGSHLERYLLEYKHKVIVRTNKIFLKADLNDRAVEKPWTEVQKILAGFKKITVLPSQPWLYGPLGLQNKDMYDWNTLQPFKWADPFEWKIQYIFEVCVYLTGSPMSLTGNHSWVRLRTPAGEVYSVGLYRTGKHGANQNLKLPLRVMSGELMSPDVSEFWPTKEKEEVRSWQFAIEREGFLNVKKIIEDEKKKGTQPFEDFDPNCTRWVVEKAKIAGISLNATENIVSLFLPRKVECIAKSLWKHVPLREKIGSVGCVPVAFAVNCLQLTLGAGRVDPSLQKVIQVGPRIAKWGNLFDPQKMVVYHPYTLADKTIPAIEAWRERETERVIREKPIDMEKKLLKITYGVPAEKIGSC